ncbi:hypothetical protein F5876DRAFT_7784, partial [Lentinula aff. lateritia]
MEFFSQFDCKIVYVSGDENTVADALSRRSDLCIPTDAPEGRTHLDSSAKAILASRHPYAFCPDSADDLDLPILCILPGSTWSSAHALAHSPTAVIPLPIATTLEISHDASLVNDIRNGYKTDSWCKDLPSMASSMLLVHLDPDSKLWYIGKRLIVLRVGNV